MVPYFPSFTGGGDRLNSLNRDTSSNYSSDDLSSVSLRDGFFNLFTGNLDYQRAIQQAERAEKTSAYQAELARKHSSEEAQKLRDWQEHMSNTAYSRAVKDLQSVGINPYAIGSFNAASTPSGAYGSSYSGSGFSSSSSSPSGSIANIASSAFQSIVRLVLKK